MKATGIIRRVDDLGRVVIPKDVRKTLHIREGDPLEIYVTDSGGVVFQPYRPDITRHIRDMKEETRDALDSIGNSIQVEEITAHLEKAAKLIEKLIIDV